MTNLPMIAPDSNASAPVPRLRNPRNVPGDFYTENICLGCCLPEAEAPDLLGFETELDNPHYGCFFKKQPGTPEELACAFVAMRVNCIDTLRYGGTDAAILTRLQDLGMESQCDYPLSAPPMSQSV